MDSTCLRGRLADFERTLAFLIRHLQKSFQFNEDDEIELKHFLKNIERALRNIRDVVEGSTGPLEMLDSVDTKDSLLLARGDQVPSITSSNEGGLKPASGPIKPIVIEPEAAEVEPKAGTSATRRDVDAHSDGESCDSDVTEDLNVETASSPKREHMQTLPAGETSGDLDFEDDDDFEDEIMQDEVDDVTSNFDDDFGVRALEKGEDELLTDSKSNIAELIWKMAEAAKNKETMPSTSRLSTSAEVAEDSFGENDERLGDSAKAQPNPNTERKTRQVMSRFTVWLEDTHNELRRVESMAPQSLDVYVGLFLMQLKKVDGTEMEPDSLTSYHRSIERYLKEAGYHESMLTSVNFESSRSILKARRKELKSMGLGNRPNKSQSITDDMIEQLWATEELGAKDGRTLQNSVFFYLTQGFGLKGSHRSRQLAWGDVQLKKDNDGTEYLEFNENLPRTKDVIQSVSQVFAPKIFAYGGERCPVMLYKKFKSHRPDTMMHDDSPFYLSVKAKYSTRDKVWYSCMAMGKNTIGRIVPSMAEKAGLKGKIVNHSLRRTTCQALYTSGIPPTVICQLMGYKDVNRLRDVTQQRCISEILSTAAANRKRPSAAIQYGNTNRQLAFEACEISPSPKGKKLLHVRNQVLN